MRDGRYTEAGRVSVILIRVLVREEFFLVGVDWV